jgi:general secretion pathway protein L
MQIGAVVRVTEQTCQAWISGELYEGLIENLPTFQGELIVLISTAKISLNYIKIPARSLQQLRQAVPFHLEEKFIDNIEELHFALGKKDKEGGVTVASIQHSLIKQILSLFEKNKLQPTIITPDVLAVPYPIDGWAILYLNGLALVRTGEQSGFAIEVELLPTILEMALNESTKNIPKIIWLYQSKHWKWELNFPNLVEKTLPDHPLGLLANNIEKSKIINLLQGDYRKQSPIQQYIKPLILTAALAFSLGIVQIVAMFQELQTLRQTTNDLSQKIETLYKNTFPDSKKIVNPRAQMAAKLNEQTKTSNTKEPFLETLLQLHQALPENGFILKKIEFKNKEFITTIEANDPKLFATIQPPLQSQGWEIQLNEKIGQFRMKIK